LARGVAIAEGAGAPQLGCLRFRWLRLSSRQALLFSSFSGRRPFFIRDKNVVSSEQADDDQDEDDYEQQVNQIAGSRNSRNASGSEISEKPKDYQDGND
jgi:hypothetical protein